MIAAAFVMLFAAPAPPAADIGPEPTIEEFAALAEPVIAGKARHPAKIAFAWPYRLAAGPAGYYTCGRAYIRGSKAGPDKGIWVSAVVANSRLVSHQRSTKNGMLEWDCKRNIKNGTIAPR